MEYLEKTISAVNELKEIGILNSFAICGGIASLFYIEPVSTYDLDIMLVLTSEKNLLNPLEDVFNWAKSKNYEFDGEYIVIEGIPVQFLPVNYRLGKVSVNLNPEILNVFSDQKNLNILLSLEPMGNAAFLGKIETRLIDNNEIFFKDEVDIAVYKTMKKRITIPLEKITKKSFQLEVELNTNRNDDGANILKVDPIVLRKGVVIK